MRDVRIAARIELLVVDPVDDPVQLVHVGAQHLVQPLAELGALDLRGVPLADCVDHVREMDAATQQVHHVVEPRDADPHQAPLLQACKRQGAEAVHALRRQVVNREGGRYVGQGPVGVQPVEQVGHERTLPVVEVDDVGAKVQRTEHLQQSPREEDEPRVVVAEAVHAVAVE